MKDTPQRQLTSGVCFGYGMGQFGEGIAYNFFYYYYTYFLVTVIGLSPGIAGTVAAFAVLWDAVSDLIVGYISDHTKNPKGRNRPLIARAIVPLIVTVALLFIHPPISNKLYVVYIIIINFLFWLSFTFCDVPWIIMGSEITDNFDERTRLRTVATMLLSGGGLVVAGFTLPATASLSKLLGSAQAAWVAWAVIMGLLAGAGFTISVITTKGRERSVSEDEISTPSKESPKKIMHDFMHALKAQHYMPLLLMTLAVTMAYGLFSSGSTFLMECVYHLPEKMIAAVNIFSFLLTMAFTLLMGAIATKTDKRMTVLCSLSISAISMIILSFAPQTLPSFLLVVLSSGIGQGAFWTLIFSMLSDVTELDNIATGQHREGTLCAFLQFMTKAGTALGMWLLGVGMEWIGYDMQQVIQLTEVQTRLKFLILLPIGLLMALGAICAKKYKLSRMFYEKTVLKSSGSIGSGTV